MVAPGYLRRHSETDGEGLHKGVGTQYDQANALIQLHKTEMSYQ